MTKPAREKTGLAEYKSTKRKKTGYDEWRDVPWKEQKELGGEFAKAGEGGWPVHRILKEQKNRKNNNRLEYLVLWKQHPVTRELWEPQWVWVGRSCCVGKYTDTCCRLKLI